jgi:hypothetical protein
MKMRIKKYFLPYFLPVIAVLCFLFLSPAFAEMKKVDETELARANASVTGASNKESHAGAVSAVGTTDKTVLDLYPPDSKDSNSFSLKPPTGPETTYYDHTAYNNGNNQLYWGGGTTANYIRSH